MKDKLITICIQPENLEYTVKLIKQERVDYENRIENAIEEYNYFKNNKKDINYIEGANHTYSDKEKILANEIHNFLKKI